MARHFLLLALAASAVAQTTPATFDVASIHTAAVVITDPHAFPIHSSPISVTMRSVTLRGAIAWSWSVMDSEVRGPGWLDSEHYDVVAKASAPHSEQELRRMFRTVLAERFGVSVHTERKEVQAYVLSVDKNGMKLKPTDADGESMMEPLPKRMAMSMQRTSIPELATMLSRFLQTTVVDETRLKGRYDAILDMTKYAQEMRPPDGSPVDMAGMMTTVLREELGLRLTRQKTELDVIVVDRAEKTPQPN